MQGGIGEVVGELVLFEVGEADGREGGEQRGARKDGAIVDGSPDGATGTFNVLGLVDLPVLGEGLEPKNTA